MEQVGTYKGVKKLPCTLTEDEVRLRGIDLANATKEHIDLQDAKKASAREFKDKIDAVNDTIIELKDAVRHGVEIREVDVEIRKNRYTGKVTTVRMDTAEVIDVRMMNEREMQGELDLDDEGESK